MTKKWFLLLAVVVMAMGVMVGCSGGEGLTEETMLQDPAVEDAGVTEEPAADPAADPAAETPEAGTDVTTETTSE